MKTLLKLFSICIIASIAFASCKSNSSITKRHYNKGYYVSHSKHLKTKPKVTENLATSNNKPEQNLVTIVEKVSSLKVAESILPVSNNEIVVSNEGIKNKATPFKNFKNNKHFNSVSLNKPTAEISKTNIDSIPTGSGDDDDSDGLSFFGFLVLLVLILWALGFFVGGFGGLIHLLLVVALVLLILWLLRVI